MEKEGERGVIPVFCRARKKKKGDGADFYSAPSETEKPRRELGGGTGESFAPRVSGGLERGGRNRQFHQNKYRATGGGYLLGIPAYRGEKKERRERLTAGRAVRGGSHLPTW